MQILDRYVIGETVQVLLIGSLCVLGIFFGTVEFQHVLQLLNEFGLPPSTVLSIMLLQVPTGLTYCMPAGVLLSTLITMDQQQRDSEILALQVSGVSLKRIIMPYVLMGLIGSVIAFSASEYVAPQTRMLSEKLLLLGILNAERPFVGRSIVEIKDQPKETGERGGLRQNAKIKKIMVLGNGVGRSINGFVLIDLLNEHSVKLIWAEKAEWSDGKWELKKGRMFDLLGNEAGGDRGQFRKMRLGSNSALMKDIVSGPMSTLEKTTAQLRENIDMYTSVHTKPPAYLLLQYYRRFAHPLSCLFLVLAAAPLMVPSRRRTKNLAFCYGGLTIVFFFVFQQICLALAENHRLDPLVGAWLPSTLLCAVGLTLLLFQRKR